MARLDLGFFVTKYPLAVSHSSFQLLGKAIKMAEWVVMKIHMYRYY